MRTRQDRSLKASGAVTLSNGAAPVTVDIDVQQRVAERVARGTIRVVDPRTAIEITAPGALQVADRWASLTTMARVGGTLRPITIIVDQGNTLGAESGPSLTLDAGESYRFTAPFTGGRVEIAASK